MKVLSLLKLVYRVLYVCICVCVLLDTWKIYLASDCNTSAGQVGGELSSQCKRNVSSNPNPLGWSGPETLRGRGGWDRQGVRERGGTIINVQNSIFFRSWKHYIPLFNIIYQLINNYKLQIDIITVVHFYVSTITCTQWHT